MKEEIKVPPMGESITEAMVGTLLKPSGSAVQVDDEILELETDKVNQALYAKSSGIVSWHVKQGDKVKVGQVLGVIDSAAKQEALKEEKGLAFQEKPAFQLPGIRYGKEAFVAEVKKGASAEALSYLEKAACKSPPASQEARRETRRKMPPIRQAIAKRLVEAQQTTAVLTTFNEVDCSAIAKVRQKYQEFFQQKYGVKLGLMPFFVKAVVAALREVPELNSYIDQEEIVHREYFDIGIAVGTERGLIVPVLRNSEQLSFAKIQRKIEEYAEKAREGKLAVDDLQGGGFTISNGGVYGSLLSTPLLNPPQSGILGMHKIEKRAVVIEDQIAIRPMMYVALSYDHRLVDGKEAVSFLVKMKNALEDPLRLLMEV